MEINNIVNLLKKILEKQEEITNLLDIILELLTDYEDSEEDYEIEAHYGNGTPIKWHSSDYGTVESTYSQEIYTN